MTFISGAAEARSFYIDDNINRNVRAKYRCGEVLTDYITCRRENTTILKSLLLESHPPGNIHTKGLCKVKKSKIKLDRAHPTHPPPYPSFFSKPITDLDRSLKS